MLGQTFIFNYYVIFDDDNDKVGLYLTTDSKAAISKVGTDDGLQPVPIDPVNPVVNPPESNSFPYWILILIIVLIIGVIFAIGLFVFMRKRRQRLEQGLDQYNNLEGSKSEAGNY